jgi:hypothetical protein
MRAPPAPASRFPQGDRRAVRRLYGQVIAIRYGKFPDGDSRGSQELQFYGYAYVKVAVIQVFHKG